MVSESEEGMELEAEHIFLLMKKEYRISRNTRAQWYFKHLNQIVSFAKADKIEHFKGEIEIVSAVPQDTPVDWDWDTSHLYKYVISPSTVVTFFSHTYRLALCLDLSPSSATVDSVGGFTLLDEILTSFKHCVQGLARPFMIPGSQLLFCPKIYVTVIAHSPFLVSRGQQVLVAGWLLQQDNANSFVDLIQQKLNSIEVRLSWWTNLVEEQRNAQLAESERIVGGLFESSSDKSSVVPCPPLSMASPEVAFVSILRYGMLALELLPENSSSGIIIFTDGVFGTTDAGTLEVLLTQLRHNTVGCSFVQVGSRSCHPASSEGFLPNNDLMEFLASTTFGACLGSAPEVDNGYDYRMNVYHQLFLTWGFHKSLYLPTQSVREAKKWFITNRCFEASSIHRVQKKESDYPVNCPLHSVLSCRLREGFTIKEVLLDDDVVEVRLVLPWRSSIFVEYTIRGQWPITQGTVRCEVSVQGPYDFLHDVSCRKIQSLHSRYRQMVVQSYWALLKNLSETDQLLAHLHSFSSNPAFYTVPDAMKSGVPLFYLPPNESALINASSDFGYPQFDAFWRPICVLDLGYWQRWLHSHRISILLQHDRPIPKHLHLPSASGRYHTIQCRQASTALNAALRDFTSFVLLENHSYIGLLKSDSSEKPPFSFYLIRLTHKPPCLLIRIAFLGGTAGSIRQKVVADLKRVIRDLNFPQRQLPQAYSKVNTAAIPCCKVLHKPAVKILVRYEKMPIDFSQVAPYDPFVSINNNIQVRRPSSSPGPPGYAKNPQGAQWSTLSHYLHHKRWIWCIQGSPGLALSLNSVARILSTITKMRLEEGFNFAHSASGIFTFLHEVEMEGRHLNPPVSRNEEESIDESNNCACVVQYVLFPPHNTKAYIPKDSVSEDEVTEESDIMDSTDMQLEIVTECWVEPQAGVVSQCDPEQQFFQGLDFTSLAESFYPMDLDCISTLVTFEHLSLLSCPDGTSERVGNASPIPGVTSPPISGLPRNAGFCWDRRSEEALKDDTVTYVPFCFQLPRLLPKCSRAKLLFSTFVQEFYLPVQYNLCPADGVNELLFELLTCQLSQMGHKEILLEEDDCHQLLKNLELQPAANRLPKDVDEDTIVEMEAEADTFGTPRDANTTPRSPRETNHTNLPSRPVLLTPLNISHKSGISSTEDNSHADSSKRNGVPMWRCFVKNVNSAHVLIVLLPASFQDLKLLMLNEEHLLSGDSPHVTKVAPDLSPRSDEMDYSTKPVNEEGVFKQTTTTADEDPVTNYPASQSFSQPCSMGPTRTNSFVGTQRPRVESSAARIRAGSLDTPPLSLDQSQSYQHQHASCSVGSADQRPGRTCAATLSSPFRPLSIPSSPIFGSVTLPIYVFDCPLTSLVGQILSRGTNRKENICRDHTFREEDVSNNGFSPGRDDDGRPPSEFEDNPSSSSLNTLSQYCSVMEALYCKCLGQALFTSLQQGKTIHSRDVEAAMDLCKETLLEIDITSFIQNICGHLKDFKMKAGIDMLRQRQSSLSSSSTTAPEEDESSKWNFPLSLLRLHQPCMNLRHLHKLIRTRFQEILCLSFKPIPSLFDYYFYCPPDRPSSPDLCLPPDSITLSPGLDDTGVVEFRRSYDQDHSTSRSCSALDGSIGSSEVLDDVELEGDCESVGEVPSIPLFLHLTATVRAKKEVASQSLDALPTCLGDLLACISGSTTVLDLNHLKITLDFLCLTFPSDVDEMVPRSSNNPRTTSFCSSSSGILDANNICSTLTSQPELSDDDEGDGVSMSDDDRTESISRQLQHIPEGQRRPVKAALAEIDWMLKDEIVAFLLDTYPITETTLSAVVQHVQTSIHRPSCRRKVVPLHFVLNAQESFRRFLIEFNKISIHGHRLQEEGSFYYLIENCGLKKFQGSLDPPLGSNRRTSTSRLLVAQTSSDSNATSGQPMMEDQLVENASSIDASEVPNEVVNEIINEDIETTPDVMIDSATTLVSEEDQTEDSSPMMKKQRYESGTTSIPGRTSDSSSLVDSFRNTEDGYDGGSSNSGNECEWLKDLEAEKPKMPPFWLVLKVKEDAVTSFFHCRCELAQPEEMLRWRQIHENLLGSITALGKLINQQMLLKDLHDTRLCNQLLEPETNDDIWHQDDSAHTKAPSVRSRSSDSHSYYLQCSQQEQSGYLEAALKLQPGIFECQQVWETHFPLHPRLKTGPGKLGTSKGVQQLRFVLNAFSVNNRSNMFVYQEDSGNVFYLRLHESSCANHKNQSDAVSVSRYNADETDGGTLSSSRRSSQWCINSDRGAAAEEDELQKRSGSFSESMGDSMSLSNLSLHRAGHLLRKEDCIQLKVHGITEAGPSIKGDLVRVLQNKLDDAVLEVLHSLLSRNPACKLTSDDVHFIQKPHDSPSSILQFAVQPSALAYLPALAFYLRQNLLDGVLYTPKYMDHYSGHHFQDFSPNPAPTSDVYLYNRPQASGNRGIACIAFALVDGRGNPVNQLSWPRPISATHSDNNDSTLDDFQQFMKTSLYEKDFKSKRPGPLALMEFRIWERGHINLETLKEKLEDAIGHALWDLVLEYRLLPFPLCTMESSCDSATSAHSLPCSEPTTPVRRKWKLQPIVHEEEIPADPRSRSVSFSGLPPFRQSDLNVSHSNDSKWKTQNTSGPQSARERPLSPPISSVQPRSPGPMSPADRACERSLSTSSMTSSLAGTIPSPEMDKLELGEKGKLHPIYSETIERWFFLGQQKNVPSIRLQKASLLAPLTVPLLLKAFAHICTSLAPEMSVRIFSLLESGEVGSSFSPCVTSSLCPKQASPDRTILETRYVLIGRHLGQWKESLTGEMNMLEHSQVALKMQRTHQRFVSFVQDVSSLQCPEAGKVEGEKNLLIPRQRFLWLTINQDHQFTMWMYNFNKDSLESLSKQCGALIQWHNARWALLNSIVAQKLGLFHNQQCSSMRTTYLHPTLRNNPFIHQTEMDTLVKMYVPPPSRDYNASNNSRNKAQLALPHTAHLEAFRDSKPARLLSNCPYGQQGDLVVRHGQQWIEKRYSERREEMQRLQVLWQSRSSGNTISITEDVMQLFKQVARIIHFCFTPLLFLPKWRMQVARTRDPNMATIPSTSVPLDSNKLRHESGNSLNSGGRNSPNSSPPRQPRRPTDDHWHQSLCSAYLQEYVQYLHTLGFLQMDIKPLATKRGPKSALKSQRTPGEEERVRRISQPTRTHPPALAGSPSSSTEPNMLHFHKSHQGGILVCEVAVQEPFFYTKVYALEPSRMLPHGYNGPNLAHMASAHSHFTDRFLTECDHIKVLLHLHSFTYDFHLRCLNSFVSGRQFLLKPAFHLVSFLDDFSKYYNKAPNFARNQVVSNSLSLKDPATPGEQLFNYLLSHERRYGFHVLRMVSSSGETDDVTTEFVLAKQWTYKSMQRDFTELKQMDDYDVTLLVSHDQVGDDPLTLFLKYFVIMSSKRDFYPRLLVEKKPGKFRTVSTATPVKAASAPPLETGNRITGETLDPPLAVKQMTNEDSAAILIDPQEKMLDQLSVSNPEVSLIQRKDSTVSLTAVPEETRTSPSAAVAAAAAAAAAAAVKHPNMRSPMFIRQEVINYLGYYTKHEQDMQSMMSEQAKKAEDLIRAIANQAKVHCRRDTLWQRLQQQANGLTYTEFRELLTLSHSEPVSSSEPQLVPLLAQPVSWYQGLAKVLLSRYPETQRHFSSMDGAIQYVVILNPRLSATAMMLFWDIHADRAELSALCREMPTNESDNAMPMMENGCRPIAMQSFIEEFVNLCCFNMWMGLLG